MQLLGLVLALALGPSKAVLSEPHLHLARTGRTTLALDVGVLAPVDAATPQIETLGAILADGVVLPGGLHLGLDGQPAMPFLNPFFYSQEIRITQVDPMSLAASLLVTARVEF